MLNMCNVIVAMVTNFSEIVFNAIYMNLILKTHFSPPTKNACFPVHLVILLSTVFIHIVITKKRKRTRR